MAQEGPITLYGSLICPYVQRARFALEHLQVPFAYEEVDLATNQQQSEWYTQINPCQKVPTIKQNNNLIFESLVILDYLEEVYGKKDGGLTLYPSEFDAAQRAKLRIWVRIFEDRVLNNAFRIYQLLAQKDENGVREVLKTVQSGLKYVAKHSGLTQRLKDSGDKQYFWGKELSYADFAILPNLNSIVLIIRLGTKLDVFQALEEQEKEHLEAFGQWFAYAVQNESFQRSNYRLPVLPPAESSAVLSEQGFKTIDNWDYERYFRAFFQKRFNIALEA